MDLLTLCLLQALALLVAPLTIPITLYVSMRFGLVGGTPRELVAAQLELERKKASVEELRAEAMRSELALRQQRQEAIEELKKTQHEQSQPVPRRLVNPMNGFRG